MASVFTRIIDGELPGTFVWRDEVCVVFMSINPLRPGHALVVPKLEIDHWLDCPDTVRDRLFHVAQAVGQAQKKAFSPSRVGLMIVGDEVPHTHLHVVPIERASDLDFANAALVVSPDELADTAQLIIDNLAPIPPI